MNQLLLYKLIDETAAALEGRRFRRTLRMGNVVSFELHGRGEVRYLVVAPSTPGPFLFLTTEDPLPGFDARRFERVDVQATDHLFQRLDGVRVGKPIALPDDRVLRLPLESDGEPQSLYISLFGASARIRVETDTTIVESLDPRRMGAEVPPSRPPAPMFANAKAADIERFAKTPDDLHALAGVSDAMIDAFRGPSEDDNAGAVDGAALVRFRDEFLAGTVKFNLAAPGRIGDAAPVPVDTVEGSFGPYKDAPTACDDIGDHLVDRARASFVQALASPLTRYAQGRDKLVHKLSGELAEAEAADAGRAEADILAAYQTQVPDGADSVELPDLYKPGEKARITLDPALPITDQIQKRYKRAAKLERGRDTLEMRLREAERQLEAVENISDDAAFLEFDDAVHMLLERHAELLPRRKVAKKRGNQEKTWRRYDVGAGWYVLVGRSDAENDELTFKVASPDDIWMHAQQVPGSHIVLKHDGKGGNPPGKTLEAAAAIAAHYSKAKHAGLVPVIWTRRKYVRKFRGAKPGQVRCEREKTIFAEPALPQ